MDKARESAVTRAGMRQWFKEMVIDNYRKYKIEEPFQIVNMDETAAVVSSTSKFTYGRNAMQATVLGNSFPMICLLITV